RSGVMDVHQEDRYGLYVELAKLITDCPVAYTGVNGGVKSGHWATQNPATLDLGLTCATWRRPVDRAPQIAGG
ncbi:MAG: hypothetical protein ABF308_16790, partial [Phaeobacter gallaeciensis]